MTNPLSKSSLRAAIATSVALAFLIVVQPLSAQQRYGKTPPGSGKIQSGLLSFGKKKAARALPSVPRHGLSLTNTTSNAMKAAASATAKINTAKAIEQVQFETPVVELPSASFEGSAVVPPASEVVVPAIEGVVPSYEVPLTESQGNVVYPEYPNEGEVIIEEAPFQQQYQPTADAPAPIYSTGTWFRNGDFYFEADMVWLNRETPEPSAFARTGALTTNQFGQQVFDDTTLDDVLSLNYASGTRLTLGRFLGRDAANRDYSLDFTYLGGFNWDESASLISREGGGLSTRLTTAGGTLAADNVVQGFIGSDRQDIQYESDLNSFELNYRIRTRPGRDQLAMQPDGRWVRHGVGSQMRSLLAGVRYVSLQDGQTITATESFFVDRSIRTRSIDQTDEDAVDGPEIADAVRGNYNVETNNRMFGLQVGGELTEKYDEWTWGLRGKVGGLINFANRNNLVNSRLREATFTDVETNEVPALNAAGDPVFIIGTNAVTGEPLLGTAAFDANGNPNDRATDTVTTSRRLPVNVQASGGDSTEQMTFLAEVGLFGTYQIRPNFHFRAAYDFMLLAGVGIAGDNASLQNGFGAFNSSGSAFLHGGSFGFETSW